MGMMYIRSKRIAAILLLAALLVGSPARAERMRVFEDANFEGWNKVLLGPQNNLPSAGFTRRVRSVRILSGSWLVCAKSSYAGDCFWISRDIADMRQLGFNGVAGSAKPERILVSRYDWGAKKPPHDALVLFSDQNYAGQWSALSDSVPDLQSPSMRRPASLVVQDGVWRLCSAPHYSGRCITITGDAWNFREIFIDPIASIERMSNGTTNSAQR